MSHCLDFISTDMAGDVPQVSFKNIQFCCHKSIWTCPKVLFKHLVLSTQTWLEMSWLLIESNCCFFFPYRTRLKILRGLVTTTHFLSPQTQTQAETSRLRLQHIQFWHHDNGWRLSPTSPLTSSDVTGSPASVPVNPPLSPPCSGCSGVNQWSEEKCRFYPGWQNSSSVHISWETESVMVESHKKEHL